MTGTSFLALADAHVSGVPEHSAVPPGSCLLADEGLFDRHFGNVPFAVAMVGLRPHNHGVVVQANVAFAALLGRQQNEIVGLPIRDLTHPDDIDGDTELMTALIGGSITHLDHDRRFLRGDGTSVSTRLSGSCLRSADGIPQATFALVHDLTDLEEKANQLRHQQRLLANGERFSCTGSWSSSPDDPIGSWSAEAYRIFGLDPTLGTPDESRFLAVVHPDDRARVRKHITSWWRHDDRGVIRYRIVRPDGEVRHLRDASAAELRPDGTRWLTGAFQDVTDQVLAEQAAAQASRSLTVLWRANESLLRAQDESSLLQAMCDTVVAEGGYRFVWYGKADPGPERLVRPVAWAGHGHGYLDRARVTWGPGPAGSGVAGGAIREGVPHVVDDILTDPRFAPWRSECTLRRYRSAMALPVLVDGCVDGVLTMYADTPGAFDGQARELMGQLSADLGYGLGRLRDAVSLTAAIEGVIDVVSATVEVRDPYTAGHQDRVSQLSVAIARRMGLSDDVVRGIALGAKIHDIGKIAVPAEILNKPGKLNAAEMTLVRSHSTIGSDIVGRFEFPWPIADMVRQHHERLDGSGYPDALTGNDIRLESRIIAVADVIEAMAHHRPYRAGLGLDAALAEATRGAGRGYDEQAVWGAQAVFSAGFAFGD